MMSQISDIESLPATPRSTRHRDIDHTTFLWTKVKAVRDCVVEHEHEEVDSTTENVQTDIQIDSDSATFFTPEPLPEAPAEIIEEERTIHETTNPDEGQKRSEDSSTKNIDWRKPNFASFKASQRRSERDEPENSDSGDDVDSPPLPPSTVHASRSWRIPLVFRANEAISTQNRTQNIATNLLNREADDNAVQIGLDDEADDLPRLEDTDDSDMEDEDEEYLDELEMQDYLRYRLHSGLTMLDERLGHEARHAAQMDLDNDAQIGGLACGGILEVVGTPGCGKTTLLMQLALQERIHALLQAAASFNHEEVTQGDDESQTKTARQVVLIDTEGSVSALRLARMAIELIARALKDRPHAESETLPSRDTLLQHTLAGVHLCRCLRLCDLLATFEMLLPSASQIAVPIETIPNAATIAAVQAKQLPINTSLILIDSIGHFFRAPASEDPRSRKERQHAFACVRSFVSRVHTYGIKLIASNQMSSTFVTMQGERVALADQSGTAYLRPSMREWIDDQSAKEAWKLLLYRADVMHDRRIAKIIGRPSSLTNECDEAYWSTLMPYLINAKGILEAAASL